MKGAARAHLNDSPHHSVMKGAAREVVCNNLTNTHYTNLNKIILIHETLKRMKSVCRRISKGETGRWCSMMTFVY